MHVKSKHQNYSSSQQIDLKLSLMIIICSLYIEHFSRLISKHFTKEVSIKSCHSEWKGGIHPD